MFLASVGFHNFRGFSEFEIDFDSDVAVFVGVNGAGKTAILDGIALALEPIAHELARRAGREGMPSDVFPIPERDVTRGKLRQSCAVSASLNLGSATRSIQVPGNGHVEGHVEVVAALAEAEQRPILIYYPANRGMGAEEQEPELYYAAGELNPYLPTLGEQSDAWVFQNFELWFRVQEDLENEQIRQDRSFIDPLLEAVRQAICSFLPEFSNVRIRRSAAKGPTGFVVDKQGVTFALRELSHGERMTIATVGDLARRLVLANPKSDAPLASSGLVLIDEPEIHLHPRWQRDLIGRLRATFPGLQFIIATQSPHIVAQVPASSVVVIEDFKVKRVPFTEGRDANSIIQ
jgi:predicted ATP-binding protein involved in virulence